MTPSSLGMPIGYAPQSGVEVELLPFGKAQFAATLKSEEKDHQDSGLAARTTSFVDILDKHDEFILSERSLAGGEIHEYTSLLEDSRRQAIDRMVANASAMGANAVVRMMFDSSEMGTMMTEIVAYGTAVTIVPDQS